MTNTNPIIELLKHKVAKIKDTATERSYYPLLCSFIEEYAKSAQKLRNPCATPEETSKQYEKHVGFPDITVRNGNALIGWIEVKSPKENLTSEKFREQFTKYKDSLENIIFTNLREWQLWQWGKEEGENNVDPKKTAELIFDLTSIDGVSSSEFENFLTKFFEGRAYQTRTPKQLALALAKKTRLLSKQVEEALETHNEESDLQKLKETFEKTLIQDISGHQFANMVAETMAYSLFLAALEHSRRSIDSELTLTNAIDYLPINVPILADLYSLIKKVAGVIPNIYEATRLLVDQLNASEIGRIHQKLVEHKPGEDPVIQFYEPFLKEYDPKEREARGVYYTPKPVVDYIVKSVDWILRNKFGKKKGLADESVHILDPSTGTGTFLMSAIQEIYGNIRKENKALGEEMVRKEFNRTVLNHILKHFYGFELLIAPYAIAHLKLTLEVERLGFEFALTKGDGDKDNDRFKVYLANTLDDPEKPPLSLFGFDSIPQESESARKVKKDIPILAIIGNPPYSNYGRMNQGEWISSLLRTYKEGLKEKKINLDDDFIKFIRFAQWKLEKTGQGIFAMITSNTFIDGLTHRQMRYSLMQTFNEIYIYNLHGSHRKGETGPNNSEDQNVFDIMTGVSINVFVKYPKKENKAIVKYSDLWGLRNHKFTTLLGERFENGQWEELNPKEPNWFFVKKNATADSEYKSAWSLNDISKGISGIETKRDHFAIDYDLKKLRKRINDFVHVKYSDEERKSTFDLRDNEWVVAKAVQALRKNSLWQDAFVPCLYRPFDKRWIIYSDIILSRDRGPIMAGMIKPNLGLIASRQTKEDFAVLASNSVCTHKIVTVFDRSFIFPLYTFSATDANQSNLWSKPNYKANLSPEFIKEFSKKLGLNFVLYGHGDLSKTFGPEDIFFYAYAIFHSPTYRTRYTEQLKIDFPRLPLTSNKELFKQLVPLGNKLVTLHLLGENPFDKSKTILDDSKKWDIKIGGVKPENLEDWKVTDIRYDEKVKRVYVNKGQYFEGIEKEVWEFMIGGYQVCEKWLKDRKKADCSLSTDDLKHYMKIVVAFRETIRLMAEIDRAIPSWPIE